MQSRKLMDTSFVPLLWIQYLTFCILENKIQVVCMISRYTKFKSQSGLQMPLNSLWSRASLYKTFKIEWDLSLETVLSNKRVLIRLGGRKKKNFPVSKKTQCFAVINKFGISWTKVRNSQGNGREAKISTVERRQWLSRKLREGHIILQWITV